MENTLVKYINEQPYEIRQLIADFHRVKWVEEYVKRRSILRKRIILASFASREYDSINKKALELPMRVYIKEVYPIHFHEGESIYTMCLQAREDVARYYCSKDDRKGIERLGRVQGKAARFFYHVRDEIYKSKIPNYDDLSWTERFNLYRNIDYTPLFDEKRLDNLFLNFDSNKHGY